MTSALRRAFATCVLLLASAAAVGQSQSTLLPPQCAGKSGAQLDQCVRDLTAPGSVEQFDPVEQKANPAVLMNCNVANSADQGFCIAHNEIVLECRSVKKYPDFDACANRLIARPPPPREADCSRVAANQKPTCTLRNKVFADCLKDPWLYFICLGEKLYAK